MPFCWTGPAPARHCARVFLIALLACWFAGTPSWASTIERVRVDNNSLVITFDGGVADASSFILDDPRRIAVDVSGATPGGSAKAGGPIDAIRQGPHGDGGARETSPAADQSVVVRAIGRLDQVAVANIAHLEHRGLRRDTPGQQQRQHRRENRTQPPW